MLWPIHASGTKPALFLVHGMIGDMTFGTTFSDALGPDRPLYAIHANGMDGREPVIDNMADMVRAYVEQIRRARPTGPVHIGGFCVGGLAAMEVASALLEEGRQVGPVILADPPPVPPGLNERNRAVDVRNPVIAEVIYQSVHKRLLRRPPSPSNDIPFDPRDPQQLHVATLAGAGAIIALQKHVPRSFFGPAQVIVTAPRAAQFFDSASPWHWLLPGPRMVHVVPWNHAEFFRAGLDHIARVLKFLLEESTGWGAVVAQQRERTVA